MYKRKLCLKKCIVCGTGFHTSCNRSKFCSNECRKKFYKITRPTNKQWYSLTEFVNERDNYKCQDCGSTKNLHTHHIKSLYEGGNNNLKNLITVCAKCHAKRHNLIKNRKSSK